MIRSAEHVVCLHAELLERTTSPRSINPGERVRRPKDLACPKCNARKWKLGAGGKIVCDGGTTTKCKAIWPSEIVTDSGTRGPRGKPPGESALGMLCTLGLVLSTSPAPNQPPPMTRWQKIVLELHAELGRSIPRDIEQQLAARSGERPRGRLELLVFALRVRHRGTRYGTWTKDDVRRLLRGAERRVEARLRRRGLMA